jgi:hypothetical protein
MALDDIMVRTQIQLSEDQHVRLKRWASRHGISLSEAVRRCVEQKLSSERTESGRKSLVRDALAVCGKYDDPDGALHVGRDHDKYLEEAFRP